ncbi:MAG: hypothetical protein LZ170_06710 [Thaumarchaeota archaeon]|nr:hypothetical protein [Candidatus Terraquivivens yellowstonensis]
MEPNVLDVSRRPRVVCGEPIVVEKTVLLFEKKHRAMIQLLDLEEGMRRLQTPAD